MKEGIRRTAGWGLIAVALVTVAIIFHQAYVTDWLARSGQVGLSSERAEIWNASEVQEVLVTTTTIADDPRIVVDGAFGVDGDNIPKPPTLKVEEVPEAGSPFALIRIAGLPELEDGWNVVEGIGREDLKIGVGHMPGSALPGQPGNTVISGHRTTYGQPFFNLDTLSTDSLIEVDTAIGTHTYQVRAVFVVEPTDSWVAAPRDGAWLTLTTCNPKYSAEERLIVSAELVAGPNLDAIRAMG